MACWTKPFTGKPNLVRRSLYLNSLFPKNLPIYKTFTNLLETSLKQPNRFRTFAELFPLHYFTTVDHRIFYWCLPIQDLYELAIVGDELKKKQIFYCTDHEMNKILPSRSELRKLGMRWYLALGLETGLYLSFWEWWDSLIELWFFHQTCPPGATDSRINILWKRRSVHRYVLYLLFKSPEARVVRDTALSLAPL